MGTIKTFGLSQSFEISTIMESPKWYASIQLDKLTNYDS